MLKLKIPKNQNIYYKRNPQYFNELVNLIANHKSYSSSLNSTKRHLREWIYEQIQQLKDENVYSDSTRIYWILNGLTDFPVCKSCNKNDNIKHRNVKNVFYGYSDHCSLSCMQKDPTIQAKKMKTRNGLGKKCTVKKHKRKIQQHKDKVVQSTHNVIFVTKNNMYFNNSKTMFFRLIDILKRFPNGYIARINSKRQRELRKWIDDQVPILNHPEYKLGTKLHWILRGLTDFPCCKNQKCSIIFDKDHVKPRKYNVSPFGKYEMFCSHKCCSNDKDIQLRGKKTKLKRYGNENFNNRKKAFKTTFKRHGKDAFKKAFKKGCMTKLTRYGNKFWNNAPKASETKANFSKDKIDSIVRKIQNTCQKLYGYKIPSQNPKIMKNIVKKVAKTCLKRFGVTSYTKTKEFIQRVIDHNMKAYGKPFYFQTDEFKEKSKQTCIEEYGTECYTQSQEFKDLMSDPEMNERRMGKQFETKKRNGTLNTSSEESRGYELLCNLFGKEDVLTQFKSEAYPFHCDYYVKSRDLYIELNQHWSHGGHFFDETDESDVALANKWASSDSKYYRNCAYVWTDLDRRKHEAAINNKLKYLVFWSIEELEIWCSECASK